MIEWGNECSRETGSTEKKLFTVMLVCGKVNEYISNTLCYFMVKYISDSQWSVYTLNKCQMVNK